MLKLGCMSLSYKDEFAANKLDLEQFIERAYQLGLDGIDIHTRAFASLDPAYLRSIRMQAFRRGLALSYIGVSSNFGKPQDELAAEVSTAKEWIDVAAFMGIPLVRVFAAWIPEGDSEEDVWARMMPCLEEVAAHGEEKGVVVGLHNHNHGCVTRTGKDVRRIIEGVNNPLFLAHPRHGSIRRLARGLGPARTRGSRPQLLRQHRGNRSVGRPRPLQDLSHPKRR